MLKRRGLAVFAAAFAVVLVSGAAVAQMGGIFATDQPAEVVTGLSADEPARPDLAPVVSDTPERSDDETASDVDASGNETPLDQADLADAPEPLRPEAEAEASKDAPEAKDDPAPVDETAPDIAVLHPENGAHVAEKTIAFEGTTEPGATVHAGKYAADVDAAGAWRIVLVLSPGRNVARFTATDAAGNTSDAAVEVFYDTVNRQEFSAHQKYGECDAKPPFDVFWGTAESGAGIWVGSKYGHAETRAGDNGNWEIRVEFPEAPVGKAFDVVVESSDGGRKVFQFTRTGHEETRFTANQKSGESDATPPFDVFWGTAEPGAGIWVGSKYGHAETRAGDNGNWEIRVEFPEAPVGKAFDVVVESTGGGRAVFTFVRLGTATQD